MAIHGNPVQFPDPLTQRIEAIPIVPRKVTFGDGVEPGSAPPSAPKAEDGPDQASQQSPTLETVDDATAFKTVEQLVRSQDRIARNRWAIDTYYRWADAGVPFAQLTKIPNQNVWVARLAPGVQEAPAAVPNKVNDLNNKVTETLFADPPKPNPKPRTTGQQAKEAGELAAQFLRTNGGGAGINEVEHFRWAFRNALPCASSFLHYRLDEDGGGYQPYQLLAHPQAQDPQHPLVAMVQDPQTGAQVPAETADPILRYVSAPTPEAPAGQFVETAAEADRVWIPGIVVDRCRREQVRTFPATRPVEEADMVVLLLWCSLAEARTRWASVAQMTAEQLAGLASWRPPMAEMIVPYTFRGALADGMTGPTLADVGNASPLLQRRMFYYHCYVKPERMEYPNGLSLAVSGAQGGLILEREALDYTVTLYDGGQEPRCRDIPVAQVTPIQDVADLDPLGAPFDARFTGSAEAAATLYASYLDACEQRIHPHVIIRSTTGIDAADWADRSVPLILNPTDQEPSYEQFPPLPDVVGIVQDLHQQQDTASGLTATAQGLESSDSQSGVAKQLTVRQAQISLSGMQQQLHNAFMRGWRICCQIAQAKFTIPRLIEFSGEGGSSDVRYFTGQDFAGIDDIGIEPGTGTMMTAEAKANYVAFVQGQQWLPPDRAADVGLAGIARDLGLPPNPAEEAIERSITLWLQGPTPEWMQEYQVFQRAQAQAAPLHQQWQQLAQQAQQMGQPAPQEPPMPQAPVPASNPFPPRPCDTEPDIALTWMKRLSKLMLSPEYTAQPPEWRTLVDQQYLHCRQALQPPPPPAPVQGSPPAQAGAPPKPPSASHPPAQLAAAA